MDGQNIALAHLRQQHLLQHNNAIITHFITFGYKDQLMYKINLHIHTILLELELISIIYGQKVLEMLLAFILWTALVQHY